MLKSARIPTLMECLPTLRKFPGVSDLTSSSSMSPFQAMYPHFQPREEEIAIPSTMGPTTRQSDLPTSPPPPQFWALKKLDASANVMDYWIRAEKVWDLEGIQSDLSLSADDKP